MSKMNMIKKVDLDQQNYTYSSYVVAGDFIFTSISRGGGKNIEEQTENSIKSLEVLLKDAGVTLDEVVKTTVTIKRGEDFEKVKDVYRCYFQNGYPARNTIIVEEFLNEKILMQIEAIAYKPKH
jgi:2-iminobutanoate/2-iminopropanoate deaminase